MGLNEADTRAKLIDPKLHAAGWAEDRITREHYIQKDRRFTRGRIYLVGDEGKRREPKKTDYLLRYSDSLPIAVVEAKPEDDPPDNGLQQAKTYAQLLRVPFAYSSNGHGIVEFDFLTNSITEPAGFPGPENLWERYTKYREVRDKGGANPLLHPCCPASRCGKEPHYFQEAAISAAVQKIMQGQKKLLLAMATGSGKTFVAFQVVWKLIRSGWLRRALFLTDRNFLRDNAYNTFAPFEDGRYTIEAGKFNPNRDVYFSTYQAMWSEAEGGRVSDKISRNFFDLIIIDECHRSGFGTWNEILQHFPDAIQLGMTATPKRTDNVDTYLYFGDPVYSYSLGQGIEDGFLATYKVHKVRTNVDREGLHIQDARLQGAEIYVPEEAELRDWYYTPNFEREITLPDRTQKMSQHLAGLLRTFGSMKKTMIFCVDMDHAQRVAGHLQNLIGSPLGIANYAVRIVSEEPDAKDLYEQFRDSDRPTPVVATTADLLTTGVDVPSVQNIVFMKTVSSPEHFKQIVGRGTRTDDATDKLWFRIIDYTNATRLFDDWDRPPGEPPEPPKGPRNSSLTGEVIDAETWNPIPDALVTVLCGPNEQVQQRSDADGRFAFSGLPATSLTVIATARNYRQRQVSVQTFPETAQTVSIELRPAGAPTKKIEVRKLKVYISEEATFMVEATGQQLTLQEYIDYSRLTVLKSAPTVETLREIWTDAEAREEFLKALEEASVHVEVLAEVLAEMKKAPRGDEFDVLAWLAFGLPMRTRHDRVQAFETTQQPFLNKFSPQAREVILALLEKYKIGGAEELAKPEVFRVQPFDRMGQAPGVIRRFGDADNLRRALNEIQKRLYTE